MPVVWGRQERESVRAVDRRRVDVESENKGFRVSFFGKAVY